MVAEELGRPCPEGMNNSNLMEKERGRLCGVHTAWKY